MRRLEVVKIFDWYDGIVLALVKLSGHEGTFLASLLAWSQSKKQRVFVLIPQSESESEELQRRVQANWNDFMSCVQHASQCAVGSALLVRIDERSNDILAEAFVSVSSSDVNELVVADAGEALDPSRDRWLKAL